MANDIRIIFEEIGAFFNEIFDFQDKKIPFLKPIAVFLFLLSVIGISYVGYRWYVQNREQRAQLVYSENFDEYTRVSGIENPDWNQLEVRLANGYSRYSNSYLAPYFLALQADVQLKQHKDQEAAATLTRVINLTDNAQMKEGYTVKKALLQMDMSDESMQKEGLHSLLEIARQKGAFSDMALFYLGRYYHYINNNDDAQKSLQELADMQWVEGSASSPWVFEAQKSLKNFG